MALVPLAFGLILWLFNEEIALWEWITGAAIAFIVAGITHAVAIQGMLDDVQTLSGQVTHAIRIPTWLEYYEEAIYRTEHYTTQESYSDSKGRSHTRTVHHTRRVFDHWEARQRQHSETNTSYTNLGQVFGISHEALNAIAIKFGPDAVSRLAGSRTTGEHNSRMLDGDPNDYHVANKSGYIYPVTRLATWENRLKAGPSVFSYEPVPEGVKVYDWPENPNVFQSNRLLGLTGNIDVLTFDQMNSRLGFKKHVNVILIGFGKQDSSIAHYQEAKWFGGKKNDLVICFGGDPAKPNWAYVFGWTEKSIVKRNIESLIFTSGITMETLPKIEAEINNNYALRDWHQFDYMKIQPRTNTYIWFSIMMVITQTGFYWWASMNQFSKRVIQKFRNYYQ